eukprot:jgi/Mesvir1/11964/Mv00284-RA.1
MASCNATRSAPVSLHISIATATTGITTARSPAPCFIAKSNHRVILPARRWKGARCSAESPENPPAATDSTKDTDPVLPQSPRAKSARLPASSTDPISSALTRRFGIAGGLAWVGFLAFGVISEQVKTRLEVANVESNTRDAGQQKEVVTASGLRYTDVKIGGGEYPQRGDLVGIKYTLIANGVVIEEARRAAFVFGSAPRGPVTRGLLEALQSMRQGGLRKVVVPPSLAFGDEEAALGPGRILPRGSTLEYDVALERVSVSPS